MWRLALAAILSAGMVCPLLAEEVDLVYTTNNVVRVLYHITEDSVAHLMLGPHSSDWRTVDVTTVDLSDGIVHELIWQVENVSGPGASPGGFLAEIRPSVPIDTRSLISTSEWDVALLRQSRDVVHDFSDFTWVPATEYGLNSNNTIWNPYNDGHSVADISGDAKWIWWETNSPDPGSPAAFDSVFLRTTIAIVPFPPGDMNEDDQVNGLDIDLFVNAVLFEPFNRRADMNGDGVVTGLDVDPFVTALLGGGGVQTVPEPSTLLLGVVALGLVGGWRKWKADGRLLEFDLS
jgi:hypothetical protein